LVPHSKWHISLERLDNSDDYTKENTVLVCEEFNGTSQMTLEKVNFFKRVYLKEVVYHTNDEELEKIFIPHQIRGKGKHCKNPDHLYKNKKNRCLICARKYYEKKKDTPLEFIRQLIKTCTKSSRHRRRTRPHEDHE